MMRVGVAILICLVGTTNSEIDLENRLGRVEEILSDMNETLYMMNVSTFTLAQIFSSSAAKLNYRTRL